jgi:hypothetical protein
MSDFFRFSAESLLWIFLKSLAALVPGAVQLMPGI